MANIESDPMKRNPPAPVARREVPVSEMVRLDQPPPIPTRFDSVLNRRRSDETFEAVTWKDLAAWLYYVGAVQSSQISDRNRQRRFVGSFGALHPAHILVGMPDNTWFAYMSREHSIGRLAANEHEAIDLRKRAMSFYQAEDATVIALLCDLDLVSGYYEDFSELILRDAGVLLGHAALVAASLNLAFRILGTTGSGTLERLVSNLPFRSAPVGLALIGKSPRKR